MPLNDVKLRTLNTPGKHFDGGGLYLEVTAAGGRYWRLKYRFGGKEKRLAFGVYPEVTLKMARQKRDAARRLLDDGADPGEARKEAKVEQLRQTEVKSREVAGLPALGSFEAVAREWHEKVHRHKVSPGHAARTITLLEQKAFPWLGRQPLAGITAPLVLDCLRRVEAQGLSETVHRLKQACGQVFRYGIVTGLCDRDPSADLAGVLRPVLVTHRPALLDPLRVGELMRALHGYEGMPTTRTALLLAALTFQRPGELRGAEWSEIDLDAGLYTIPPGRMKRTLQGKATGAPHLVPLSQQAVALLRELQPLTGAGRLVFPGLRSRERPISDMTMNGALRRLGFAADEMTAHGFRAMARTLLHERLGVAPEVIEAQLAHAVPDTLGRAYNRTEFVDQRRQMMQTWADYLDRLRDGAQVIPFKTA
jgi:integrase